MRLIDADALPRHKQLEVFGNGQYEDVEVVYGNDIDNAPTINAVPKQHLVNWSCVIRCKECKYSQYDELFHMRWCNGEEVKDDDFCSYGERKDRKKGAKNE